MIKLFDDNMNEIQMDQNEYQDRLFPLDNFSAFGLIMDEKYFQTSEHAFQYLKFSDTSIMTANLIRESFSPNKARQIAHENRKVKRPDWDEVKYDLMERVIKLKIDANPTVRQALLNTGDYIIAECCLDEDTEWGIDKEKQGENRLGKILMKIRYELNKELENDAPIKR